MQIGPYSIVEVGLFVVGIHEVRQGLGGFGRRGLEEAGVVEGADLVIDDSLVVVIAVQSGSR